MTTRKIILNTIPAILIAMTACQAPSPDPSPSPRSDPRPAGIDRAACDDEVRLHCAYKCVEESDSPADRPACEVACRKRPISEWDGKIPACTEGL